ncbi:restriction endonuclease subunit S, partial [Psychrobacter sp. 1Y4]|uniref:restriction endonuclease subunit S n=1 Tax=Psychrobacter sp. 1Y4 TaxID=3453575 RepID=UPI003F485774
LNVLKSEIFLSKLYSLPGGTKQANLSATQIREISVLIPPLPEQQKIANILSTWDKAISTTERLIDNSTQQKKALMQKLLTGKKRLLDDKGERFEGEWKEGKLVDFAKIKKGKALSSKDLKEGSYPVIAGGKSSPYTHSDFTHENIITVSASGAYAGYIAFFPYKIWASDCSVVEP